jgi:hypothetical protein
MESGSGRTREAATPAENSWDYCAAEWLTLVPLVVPTKTGLRELPALEDPASELRKERPLADTRPHPRRDQPRTCVKVFRASTICDGEN